MTEPQDEFSDRVDKLSGWIDDGGDPPESAGSDSDESDAKQLLMNSLLRGHFENADDREARIQGVLDRFDQLAQDDELNVPASRDRSPKFSSRMPRVVASLAALLLAAVCIWYVSIPQTAEASLRRVIESVEVQVIRVYKGTISGKWLGRRRVHVCTLRSLSSDKFVVEMHNTLVKPKLIGSDGNNRWTVAGQRTWNSTGNKKNGLRDFLIDRVTLSSLQINQLMTQIPDNYELKLLEPEQLPGDDSVDCRPIEATLVEDESGLPDRVRIWPHPRTGVIARMVIVRKRRDGLPSTRIELEWMGEEPASDEVFRPEYYLGK